ncbi:hypothetical protein [Treponema sp. C6A8]|uniref:hypothetical protein n=1 Tax=Treponema sp. C6A8 TaxID=1410609 RepID=UPI000482885D|nr:hypothetical protein [Treponema sp. C6A8]
MKKIVGIMAAAAFAATAFAEVNIGLSANQAFAPIAYDGDRVVTVGPDAAWGGTNSGKTTGRVGLSFSAETENAGVVTDIHTEDFSKDNAYGWVKPFSFLKISAGKMDNPWKRLGFGYGAWNTLRPYGISSEGDDLAFARPHQPNFQVLITPIEGLEIVWDYKAEESQYDFYDEVWNHARYGVAYTIADVGTIMAQVAGQDQAENKDGDKKDFGIVNAAFQLTGVEGLDAQFGVAVPTTFDAYMGSINLAAGAHYTFNALTFHGFFNGKLTRDDEKAQSDAKYEKFGFSIGAGVDFAVTDAWTLVGDVRYQNDIFVGTPEVGAKDGKVDYEKGEVVKAVKATKLADKVDRFIFYVGAQHNLTNANVKIGFEGVTNSLVHDNVTDEGKLQSFTFAVPVVLDISL